MNIKNPEILGFADYKKKSWADARDFFVFIIAETKRFDSFGGAAAGHVCLTDTRFKAVINLAGIPFKDMLKSVIIQSLYRAIIRCTGK